MKAEISWASGLGGLGILGLSVTKRFDHRLVTFKSRLQKPVHP